MKNEFDINALDIFVNNEKEEQMFDSIDVVNIDIEAIGNEAEGKAKTFIEDLTKFYYDEEFLKSNPNFRKRVDNEMESLRMLLKMRAADEVTHDVLIKAIAANSGNASLYRSLTQVQTTILQITTKIEAIVATLTNMIKGYQLELNFKNEQELANNTEETAEVDLNTNSTHRGSKSFIEQMSKMSDVDTEALFENEEIEEIESEE